MFGSVLIANRGEIACRVARTAKRLGMRTIAVYSAADADALHVRCADEAIAIGPAEPAQSYLSIERLIGAARAARAECVHPGYGFLSENPDFAEACAHAGLSFVGPPAAAIRTMGLKDRAKALMARSGVPVVAGYHGARQDAPFLQEQAAAIGYPVLIKAAAGGGGRGLRRVETAAQFAAALQSAVRESRSAFGSARVLVEKHIAAPRHIEFQVFGDRQGNLVHLGERDCSLQRRHQKVIEEAPAPGMSAEVRAAMGAAALTAARAVGYSGAGTVEFVADGTRPLAADSFWFIEMNTRLQVEHAVTEAVTGLDLVEWQFRVAAGEPLPCAQDQIRLRGHAFEARLYAEDPEQGFLPSTGTIVALQFPPDVRVETGVAAGDHVTPYYDPMIAKLIAWAQSRDEALARLSDALARTLIAGPRSNVAFLAALCRMPALRRGEVDTGFIDRALGAGAAAPCPADRAAAAAGLARLLARPQQAQRPDRPDSPWAARDGFQLGGVRELAIPILLDGKGAAATATYGADGLRVAVEGTAAAADASVFVAGAEAYVLRGGRQTRVRLADFSAAAGAAAGDGLVKAPMHGRLLEVMVVPGEEVAAGQRLAVIEAMKMEHTLYAPFSGVVREIAATAGAQVGEGGPIMLIEPAQTR